MGNTENSISEIDGIKKIIVWVYGDCSSDIQKRLDSLTAEYRQKQFQEIDLFADLMKLPMPGETNAISTATGKSYLQRIEADKLRIKENMVANIKKIPQESLYKIFCEKEQELVKKKNNVPQNPLKYKKYLQDIEKGHYLKDEIELAEAVVVMHDCFLVKYENASQIAEEARNILKELNEVAQKEKTYQDAVKASRGNNVEKWKEAKNSLITLGDYRASKEYIAILEKNIILAYIKVYAFLFSPILIILMIWLCLCL